MSTLTTDPMHRWFLRAAVFCLIGALIAVSADALLRSGLRRVRRGDLSVWNDLVGGRLAGDVLIVGGSRALVGVDCEILVRRLSTSCYNIGLDGSPANIQRPYVETYLLHNPPPRLAVLTVDMGSLTESRTPYNLSQYLSYLDQKPIAHGLSRYVDVWKYRYIPLYGFSQLGLNETIVAANGVVGRLDRGADRRRTLGYRPSDLPWDGAFETFAAANAGGSVFPVDEVGVAESERMISMLESRGARVVLVFIPEWAGVRPLETNRDEVMRAYATIARKHHTVFIDYSDIPLSRRQSLFYNSQHLNREGATIFTGVLANDLAGLLPPTKRR